MDTFEARRHCRSRVMLAVGAVLVITAVVVAILAGAAHGSPRPSQSAATAAQTPGGECTTAGATFTRHGDVYECVQKPWDDCLRWHHRKPANYQPPASWTRPAQRPCTTCTPSPSTPTMTTPPASTPASSPSPSLTPSAPASLPHPTGPATPSAQSAPPLTKLPVTGSTEMWIAGAGLLCIVVGAVLRFYRRSVREGDPHERSVR